MTDHVTKGLARLLYQFEGAANLRALLTSYLEQSQTFEDLCVELLSERNLAAATGHRLDGIGQILKVRRDGKNDADYRDAIQIEISILTSRGTTEDIIAIAQALATPTAWVFTEIYPKTFLTRADNYAWPWTGTQPAVVGKAIRRAGPAATTKWLLYSRRNSFNTFTTSSIADTLGSSAGQGLSAAPSSQGEWQFDALAQEAAGLTAGTFRFNRSNQMAATEMYIHRDDSLIADKTTEIENFCASENVRLTYQGAAGEFWLTCKSYTVTGDIYTVQVRPHLQTAPISNTNPTSFDWVYNGKLSGVY